MHALLAIGLALAMADAATAARLVALGADGSLRVFAPERPDEAKVVPVSGLGARLLGIDWRPADGRLWGLSERGDLYRIDVDAGTASAASTLTLAFDGASGSGVDFTPQNDRLRLLGRRGQNLRVQVQLGAAASDAALAYAASDPNASARPAVVAAAYDRNVPGAAQTMLFAVDAALDVLARIETPNDGVLATVGPLGIDVGTEAGFDIVTEGATETAFLVAGSTLHRVELRTGLASQVGEIAGGSGPIVGLAALP